MTIAPDDVIDREPKVCADTGLSPSTLRRKVKAGAFPAPVRLGQNSKGWRRSDVRAWIAALQQEQIPPRAWADVRRPKARRRVSVDA